MQFRRKFSIISRKRNKVGC